MGPVVTLMMGRIEDWLRVVADPATINPRFLIDDATLDVIADVIERFWLSEKVEDANPETLHRIEERLHAVEEVATEKLHDLGERLHLTREPNRDEKEPARKAEASKAAKKRLDR